MVKRLSCALLLLLPPLVQAAASAQAAATPATIAEKHYRQAAWAFYLQQPAQALETLQLAPQHDARTRLLEAGLYLQLSMPQHAIALIDTLLSDTAASPGALPQALKNVALLQFARYQLEQGNKTPARDYLKQVQITDDNAWLGQQLLLEQLINWPDITLPPAPEFERLRHQPEMPYIISNQALVLAQTDHSDTALDWLAQIRQQLKTSEGQGFWQLLFSGQWHLLSEPDGFIYPSAEHEALSDYVALTQAQLHIQRQEFAAADAILSNFAADSVLNRNALQLYSHILTEQRHVPALLAVLQQQIRLQPFSHTAWLAATRIGEQLERVLQVDDALGAYRWADQYYVQQAQQMQQQARPVEVGQLQQGLSAWQQLQISNDSQLFHLQQDILSVQQHLTAAAQRQLRLAQLQDVTNLKLTQQRQLLSSRLPQLRQQRDALQQQFSQLQQQISAAEQQPMPLSLWQGEPYQQLQRLDRAEQRLAVLQQHQQPLQNYPQRLNRLRGLLQWQYSNSAAERRWQRQKQLQQTAGVLEQLELQMAALARQGNKTERLQQVQQRLTQLSNHQQQLNLALLSKQQQLLAELNQQLQQRLQQQLATLNDLQRHNKESMARVMERVLLSSGTDNSGAGL
ncbi:hypothetical protein [Rheinheimera sp.]|uniref:hypothetical protein n=1 Tax=Rheinheimera sp. TaxID=1869214 RepID=UPI0037C612AC